MSDKPETLIEAVRRLTAAERAAQSGQLPDPEDLVAFRDGRLHGEAREALERILSLNPEAAQEYLDLADPSRLEAPGKEYRFSDQDVQQAFVSLRTRIRKEEAESCEEGSAAVQLAPSEQRRRRPRWQLWLPALAAALIMVLAGTWISRLHQMLSERSSPRFAAVLDVHPTRGGRPSPISSQAEEVLLVFHDAHLEPFSRGSFEILDSSGRQILTHEVLPSPDKRSLLFLPLARALLPYGSYRFKIHGISDGRRLLVQEYTLILVDPENSSEQ